MCHSTIERVGLRSLAKLGRPPRHESECFCARLGDFNIEETLCKVGQARLSPIFKPSLPVFPFVPEARQAASVAVLSESTGWLVLLCID